MSESRVSEKATRYLNLLDTARCEGKWQEVPELARKVGKHAPQRKCLISTAVCESEIALQTTKRSTTTTVVSKTLAHLIPKLRTALEDSQAPAEDVYQAKTCQGWLYWIMGEPTQVLSALPSTLIQAINPATEKIGEWSKWTHVCMVKCACIRGAAQEIVGSNNEVMETYRSVLSYFSKGSTSSRHGPEYYLWVERLLTRCCMLSSHYSMPDTDAIERIQDPELSLAPFRAWVVLWASGLEQVSPSSYSLEAATTVKRRLVWQTYYNMLSGYLKIGYQYPGSTNEGGPEFIDGYDQFSPKQRQSAEIKYVENIYEGLLLKQVGFPQAHETNTEFLQWVEQVMSNWGVLCGSTWCDEDLGQGGQEYRSRTVLEILYRAATRTFHSTSILRHLFTVHASLGEFELAGKGLDSYLEIITKGKARVQKSGELEEDLDSDEKMIQTIAAGVTMYATFGRSTEASKVQALGSRLQKWLQHQVSEQKTGTERATSKNPPIPVENQSSRISISPSVHAILYRAIGISESHWARFTSDSAKRADLRKTAIEHFRRALEVETTGKEDAETLYALALVLAETRDIESAIATVKLALSTDDYHSQEAKNIRGRSRPQSIDSAANRQKLKYWHLLALLLSARQDFDTAVTSCEAAIDSSSYAQYMTEGVFEIPTLNASLNDRKQLLEVKITQMALTEVVEGPENAVNAGGELLALYSRAFGYTEKAGTYDRQKSSPPQTANGTMKSFRGSVFGRPRTAKQRPNTAGGTKARRISEELSRPPTISITNNDNLMDEKLIPPDFNQNHQVIRQPSKKLQKQNSRKSIRSRTVSPARTASLTSGSAISFRMKKKPPQVGSSTSASEQYRPSSSASHNAAEVGVALSHDLPTMSASISPQVHGRLHNPKTRPANEHPTADMANRSTSALEFSSGKGIVFPEVLKYVSASFEPRYPRYQQQQHALCILLNVWLFISSLYRRAKMYDDADGAIDEALEKVKLIEASVASHRASSADAFDTPGWGGMKSVEELWADVYAERGNLCLARPAPHDAMIQYESALFHFPDHTIATIGLSNILLDIYSEKIPATPQKSPLKSNSYSPSSLPTKVQPKPLLASIPKQSSAHESTTYHSNHDPHESAISDDDSPLTSEDCASPKKHDKSPEALDRLAARDRAYGLLSSLTKLGTGWDNSEAWFALARAYEESGQLDKAKEVLWWVVELEEKRPIRDWSCLGQGYSI